MNRGKVANSIILIEAESQIEGTEQMSMGELGRCSLFLQSMCLPLSSYLTRNCQKMPIESQLPRSLVSASTF